MKFHHFGLAVHEFEPALGFFKNLGYTASKPVTDPLQDVELIMCTSDLQPDVELIRPLSESSPVSSFLEKNQEMIYHPCYQVKNIEEALKTNFPGMRVLKVSPPKPATLFGNHPVAFFYVKGIGLIELLEKPC